METSSKRRALIFSTAYYPFVGGAEVAIKQITSRLGDDFEFDLITARLSKKLSRVEKVGNVNVYRIGAGNPMMDKILLPFTGAYKAWSLNKTNNYFCMWAMMVTFASGAGYVFNLFRSLTFKKQIPIILTLQEGDSEGHLKYKWGGLIALSWKIALRRAKYLTAISNFLLDRANKNGWKGDAYLIPNGVDLELFSNHFSDAEKNSMAERLGKNSGDIYLVTTGRLAYKNGTDDIVTALSRLPENIYLVVIGKGDGGSKLQKQADSLNVGNRVKFLGFVPYEEIPKYFSACDIFIRPSRSEGFGNSFIEAMAARLPVIATPVGGITDFIDDNETGIFCAPNNPQSIVNAVNLILKNENIKNSIVARAFDRVTDRYGWNHVAKEMGVVFDKVV